ncbi:MAG: hypothetical protein QXP02_04830 [Desulfurococcaceae archaeon]
MSIDISVLRRLLNIRIMVEGGSGWAYREFMDLLLDMLKERLSIMLSETLEPYGLEASFLENRGCELFPNERFCEELLVIGIYEQKSDEPVLYALYRAHRGENTLEFKLEKLIERSS